MPLVHDAAKAAEFLTALYPEGPWIVSAIHPELDHDDKAKIRNAIFSPKTRGDFAAWLDEHNQQRNIYYGVNPLRAGSVRAHKEDVTEVRFLQVDIDARAFNSDDYDEPVSLEEHFTREAERILHMMQSPPDGIPRPSAVVLSGGGVNATWRLAEPIKLDHSIEAAEMAERYNIALATAFGGDHCHDISRILRMPFTVNHLNAKKRKMGRQKNVASVAWCEPTSFPLGVFRQQEPRQVNGVGSGRGRPKLRLPGNVEPIGDLSTLRRMAKAQPERIKPELLDTIAKGVEVDQEKWKDDGSACTWYVCCELLRAGVPEDRIYAVITDPNYGVSRHVLKHRGAGARRAALRAIDRAKDAVEGGPDGDVLMDLNDRHFVVQNYGGKCLVMEECYDHVLSRKMIVKQQKEAFFDRYANRFITVGEDKKGNPIKAPAGKFWWENPRRRQVRTIAFAPGQELPDDVYNLWQGFAVDAIPGNGHEMYLRHLFEVVCGEDRQNYDYLVNWMARTVQRPGEPGQVAIVLRGDPGSGKGTPIRFFGELFGRHYMQITNPKHLVGNFNAHMEDLVLVFADEAFYAGDKEHASILKTLITEEFNAIEAKNVDLRQSRNCVHLMMASNKDWVVPTEIGDRRYFILDVPKIPRPESYYAEFRHIMTPVEDGGPGGLNNLLYYLQTLDITGYDVWKRPGGRALDTQKLMSLTNEQEWWYTRLDDGRMPRTSAWCDPVPVDELFAHYENHVLRRRNGRPLSRMAFGKVLAGFLPGRLVKKKATVTRTDPDDPGGRARNVTCQCYFFPRLADCRKQWEQKMNTTIEWDEDDSEPPL